MVYILQVDFSHDRGFGEEFTNSAKPLAMDIAKEEGLLWKIWTENEKEKIAGGIYLFSNEDDAKRYLKMHTKRLESFGYMDIRSKIFSVNMPLSQICKVDFIKE